MLLNAFSLSMVSLPATAEFSEASLAEARDALTRGSAVGHTDTATLFSALLGVPVPVNRVAVSIPKGTTVVVGQLSNIPGGRLPPGATTLPEGATISWVKVTVQ